MTGGVGGKDPTKTTANNSGLLPNAYYALCADEDKPRILSLYDLIDEQEYMCMQKTFIHFDSTTYMNTIHVLNT